MSKESQQQEKLFAEFPPTPEKQWKEQSSQGFKGKGI